jgi:hypothetical protein
MEFFNKTIDFFNRTLNFLEQGIYNFFVELFAQFIIYYQIALIKAKLWAIGFAWDVAQSILSQLQVFNELNAAFGSLDSDVLSVLNFFSIPHAITILLSAATTKFVLRFMGM